MAFAGRPRSSLIEHVSPSSISGAGGIGADFLRFELRPRCEENMPVKVSLSRRGGAELTVMDVERRSCARHGCAGVN